MRISVEPVSTAVPSEEKHRQSSVAEGFPRVYEAPCSTPITAKNKSKIRSKRKKIILPNKLYDTANYEHILILETSRCGVF